MYQLGKFIGGGYGLFKTYWLITAPSFILLGIIAYSIGLKPAEPETIAWVISYLLLILITTIALWNASSRYVGNKLWKIIVKTQCLLTTIPFILAILFSVGIKLKSNINENSNLKVKFFICNDFEKSIAGYSKNNYLVEEYIIDTVKNKVFMKTHLYELSLNQEKNLGNEISELESCTIIDKNNWQCNEEKIKDRKLQMDLIYYKKRVVTNGKYSFMDMDMIDKKYNSYCKPNYVVIE